MTYLCCEDCDTQPSIDRGPVPPVPAHLTRKECDHYWVRTSECVRTHGEPTDCRCLLVCVQCLRKEPR